MKATAFLVCLTYITATVAVAIPSPAQAPLQVAIEDAEIASSNLVPAAPESGPVVNEQAVEPAVERRDELEAQVPVTDDQAGNDDGEEGSCFCSGTSICCRTDGEIDCGYGLCGVWI